MAASHEVQRLVDLATDPLAVKHDGSKAEAEPTTCGSNHEEAKAHEGKVGHGHTNPVPWRGPTSTRPETLKTIMAPELRT